MRITSGKFRGLRLKTPRFTGVRPMTERARKALFDILGPHLEGAVVVDLFCGTGALGIEALSRGAQRVTFVDASPQSLKLVMENLKRAGVLDAAQIKRLKLPQGVLRLKGPFDFIFITPPYGQGLGEQTLKALPARLFTPETVVVLEERRGITLPNQTSCLNIFDLRRYGEAQLAFYRRK